MAHHRLRQLGDAMKDDPLKITADDANRILALMDRIVKFYEEANEKIKAGTFEGDAYKYVAAKAFEIGEDQVTAEMRDFTKTALFGRRFGASPNTIIKAIADKQ
jgi:hypothetical protein